MTADFGSFCPILLTGEILKLITKIILLFFGFFDQNKIVILAFFKTIWLKPLFIENSAEFSFLAIQWLGHSYQKPNDQNM